VDIQNTRRSLLKSLGATLTVGALSGCSGDDGQSGGTSPPDRDANPETLLPDPPEGWAQTGTQEQSAGMVGAEAGFAGDYEDSEGNGYDIEILRWSSESDAEDGAEVYSSGWPVYVVHGNFSFAAKGADVDKTVTLLSNSPSLSVDYIEQNNTNS
jgi:hypothetical protein